MLEGQGPGGIFSKNIFKVLKQNKQKSFHPRILCPTKLFRIEEGIKSLSDKQKLKESITTKLAL